MKIQRQITLAANSEEIWTWLTQFEKIQIWNPSMIEEKPISTGKPRVGHTSEILIQEGSQKNWYRSEIKAYQPFSHLAIRLSGGNLGATPMHVDYRLQENNGSVTLDYLSTWQPKGFRLKLLHPLINMMAGRNATQSLATLKAKVESP